MKKITMIALLFTATIGITMAQSKQEIKKEVCLEDKNGEKVLTIKTTTNGNTTTEVYKGAEVDEKLKEFAEEKSGTTKTMIVGDDGKQHMKVETRIVIKEEETEDE